MDFSDDEKIKLHIKQVTAIQEKEAKNILTLEDLKELNMGIGVTEKEWDELLKKADDSLQLAKNHLQRNNYEDALSCAETAVEINPFIKQGNSIRAKAAYHLWLISEDSQRKYQAEQLAKAALEKNPNDSIALDVLKNMRIKKRFLSKSNTTNSRIIATLIGFFCALILFFSLFVYQPKSLETNTNTETLIINNSSNWDRMNAAFENCLSNFAEVKNVYLRKNNLVRQIVALAGLEHNETTSLLEQYNAELSKDIDADKFIEYQLKLDEITTKVVALIAESNPSDRKFETLMVELEGAQNRITFAKRNYNKSVQNYNTLVKKYGKESPDFPIKKYLN